MISLLYKDESRIVLVKSPLGVIVKSVESGQSRDDKMGRPKEKTSEIQPIHSLKKLEQQDVKWPTCGAPNYTFFSYFWDKE